MKKSAILKSLFTAMAATVLCITVPTGLNAEEAEQGSELTVTGEILDMACYIDHEAQGEKHQNCAQRCIDGGLPVGIKGEDGTVYLLIGDHKPANKELAQYAAKTITVRGKYVSRDNFKLLENIEIVSR